MKIAAVLETELVKLWLKLTEFSATELESQEVHWQQNVHNNSSSLVKSIKTNPDEKKMVSHQKQYAMVSL